jgi:hypothetical protein
MIRANPANPCPIFLNLRAILFVQNPIIKRSQKGFSPPRLEDTKLFTQRKPGSLIICLVDGWRWGVYWNLISKTQPSGRISAHRAEILHLAPREIEIVIY